MLNKNQQLMIFLHNLWNRLCIEQILEHKLVCLQFVVTLKLERRNLWYFYGLCTVKQNGRLCNPSTEIPLFQPKKVLNDANIIKANNLHYNQTNL